MGIWVVEWKGTDTSTQRQEENGRDERERERREIERRRDNETKREEMYRCINI